MAVFKCKMCGGELALDENLSVGVCPYCDTTQTFPSVDNEKKVALFNRANNLRIKNEFDKASGIYESIVSEFPDDAEAYWGLVLCKYGIEYVDDPATSRKVPTCHRTVVTSVMDDDDFGLAYENADASARAFYREEAKVIDGIQKKILQIVATEKPYDVFICYKETDDVTGARTDDSTIAQDVYTELVQEGYKVFFARVTLRDKAGSEYEPYIYSALSSAKVMLVFGTRFEYFDAVWVKNEWSRYLSMMATDNTKHIIPCYKNLDAYDIPKEFRNLQALNINDVTFIKSLFANIEGFIPKATANVVNQTVVNTGNTATVDSLLKRAFLFLEDGDFARADDFCEQVLNIDPECANAYLGKLLVELGVKKKEDLKYRLQPFDNSVNFQKFARFANEFLFSEIKIYLDIIQGRIDEKNRLVEKKKAEELRKSRLRSLISSRISSLNYATVAVNSDGTLSLFGKEADKYNIRDWSDLLSIYRRVYHVIGLKSDGTVVAAGKNYDGRGNVYDWTDIVGIGAGSFHTVGLKSDGTVVATGSNDRGQCNVRNWTDIVAVSAGLNHTVGLKSNGRVVAVGGWDFNGECKVSEWKNIVAIATGDEHTVGLKSDGTVVAVGKNKKGQCDVSAWSNIVAISACDENTVGLKSDGSVVVVGERKDLSYYTKNWTDIIGVSAGAWDIFGVKSDGTVVSTNSKISSWKLFDDINNLDIDPQKAKEKRIKGAQKAVQIHKQQTEYRSKGLCQYCGGSFSGLFAKKCTKCGRIKDY